MNIRIDNMIIRSSSGFGDAIYLYPIVKYYINKGEKVIVKTNFPEVYKSLNCNCIPYHLQGNENKPGIRPNTNKMVRFNIVVPWFKQSRMYFPREACPGQNPRCTVTAYRGCRRTRRPGWRMPTIWRRRCTGVWFVFIVVSLEWMNGWWFGDRVAYDQKSLRRSANR